MANATPDGEDGEKHDDGPPATFNNLMDVLQNAINKLKKQNIKTPAAVQIKTEVCKEISKAMYLAETLRDAFGDNAMTGFSTLRDGIKQQIKEDIKELVTSLKEKSYAQAISAPGPKPGLDPKALKSPRTKNSHPPRTREIRGHIDSDNERNEGKANRNVLQRHHRTDSNHHQHKRPS